MSIRVKVCGLTDEAAVEAAVAGGAAWFGFVFYPPSPRSITATRAAELAAGVPDDRQTVGVVVDPDDRDLAGVLAFADLDLLQLHGHESPERVAEIRAQTHVGVIKALRISERADLARVRAYAEVADHLLFDAKPPRGAALPGGNGLPFDWRLLEGLEIGRPWLLSGGLSADNIGLAIRRTGARAVDVSTGVEAAPGVKDPARIRQFLATVAGLPDPRGEIEVPVR
jgi:phosphoribosylanthranilate isomerase